MLLIIVALVLDFIMIKVFIEPVWSEYTRTRQLLKKGQFIKAPIVGHKQMTDQDGLLLFAPIAKLTTNEGKEYTIESKEYSMYRKEIGTLVNICYETKDPQAAIINPRSAVRSQWLIMIFIHVVMVGITIGAIFFQSQD